MRLLQLKTVLAATDCGSTSDPALAAAGRLAAAAGAALHVVHVAPGGARTGPPAVHEHMVSGIESALVRLGTEGRCEIDIVLGEAPDSIARVAEKIGADVIVLGRGQRSHESGTRPVGSTAYAVITRSGRSCLVVRDAFDIPLRRSLVAVDASDSSRGALLVGLSWASALRSRTEHGTLTALHVATDSRVGQTTDARRIVEEEIEQLRTLAGSWAGVAVEGVTLRGTDVAGTIARHVSGADCGLVVLGTRGLGADDGGGAELGSISAAVMQRVNAPVLLVPPVVWRRWSKDIPSRT